MDKSKPLILVVDDEESNLSYVAEIVDKMDYECAMSMSGHEVLDFLKTEIPDLILLDVMMPDMSGFEVIQHIKSDKRLWHIPVFFLTAKNQMEDVVKGFEAGCSDYITKPFNPAELRARIKTHIDLMMTKEELKLYQKFLPVCASCKAIRNEKGEWMLVDVYLDAYSDVNVSHGLCPGCAKKLYPDFADSLE